MNINIINTFITTLYLDLNILFINKKTNNKYAQLKYKLYKTRPFSGIPQPTNNNSITEKITHKKDITATLFFLFIKKLTHTNKKIITPNILIEVGTLDI